MVAGGEAATVHLQAINPHPEAKLGLQSFLGAKGRGCQELGYRKLAAPTSSTKIRRARFFGPHAKLSLIPGKIYLLYSVSRLTESETSGGCSLLRAVLRIATTM